MKRLTLKIRSLSFPPGVATKFHPFLMVGRRLNLGGERITEGHFFFLKYPFCCLLRGKKEKQREVSRMVRSVF
jgi:hypothetical protein